MKSGFIREEPSNIKYHKYVFGERAIFSPKEIDYPFSDVLNDFSNFYNLPYADRLNIAEKYNLSTFYIFLDKEKELIFGVDFAKRSEVNEDLLEVLKCTPKDIFDFEPKDEHTKRYFEKYQKQYFEEDEEIIFFEWFLKRFKNSSFDFEQYLIDYWNQIRIDNFPDEYLIKSISDLKGQIEKGIYYGDDLSEFLLLKGQMEQGIYDSRFEQNRFFLFGVEKFKRGAKIPFNGYIRELNCYWNSSFKPAYFYESLVALVTGYQKTKFYKFLVEQQKRLLKGEDITKPFEVEEKEKPIELKGFQIVFAIKIKEDLGEIPKQELIESESDYFSRVCKEFDYNPVTYKQYNNDYTNLLLKGAETMKVFTNKMKDLEQVRKYFGNDEKYTKKINEIANKIEMRTKKNNS